MTPRISNTTAREMMRVLQRVGFEAGRQTGSHRYFSHPRTHRRTNVPIHPGDLDRVLFKKILKQAGLTEDQYRNLV